MTSRPSSRRAAAPPNTLSSQPRPVLSVEEWEAKAPLDEIQNRSVASVKVAVDNVPYPLKFSSDDIRSVAGSRPGTPNPNAKIRLALQMGSRPGTPMAASARPVPQHALHPKQPVQTPQQFYDWFALIERSVAHSQEAHFRAHVSSVSDHLDACDLLVERIRLVGEEVDGMLEGWRGVEEGGKSLKEACERLLEERDLLLERTNTIAETLSYFQELEHATRLLNMPGESLVLQSDFLYMVERVDICIDFLREHRHYKEAEVYLLRFQQCLTRSMTLIRMYFVGSLRALTTTVQGGLEKTPSDLAQSHLLYARFGSAALQLRPLLAELERRARAHPEELSALLGECHQAYFSARKSLLGGLVQAEVRGLDIGRGEIVELTRAGCGYIKHLCELEYSLYNQFFSEGEEALYSYLESLCDYLYDELRPRILHEPRITSLCEVCTVLQALMVLDTRVEQDPAMEFPPTPGVDSPTPGSSNVPEDEDEEDLPRLHISRLLQSVLQDAQTRLFFKAQAVIQSDIRSYVPKPEELQWPRVLLDRPNQDTHFLSEKEKDMANPTRLFKAGALGLDQQNTWYPTLKKTVSVLEQLRDYVKPVIFEDIAQEALTLCRQSLLFAAEVMRKSSTTDRPTPENLEKLKVQTTPLDVHLFVVRHLLILKEITASVEAQRNGATTAFLEGQFSPSSSRTGIGSLKSPLASSLGANPNIKMAGVTETLVNALGKTSLIPQGLFATLGLPLNDDIQEARQGIDHDLRSACEDVIDESSIHVCTILQSWITNKRSTEAPWNAAEWTNTHSAFVAQLKLDFPLLAFKIRLYLGGGALREDNRTVDVLLQHIQDRITAVYADFRGLVMSEAKGGDGDDAATPQLLDERKLRVLMRATTGDGH